MSRLLPACTTLSFSPQVVQPLFFFLAEQVDLAGQQAEEEPALRIAYCDVNEACCSPTAVYGVIKVLQQQYSGSIAAAARGKPRRSSASASGGGAGSSSISTASQAGNLWQALQQVCLLLATANEGCDDRSSLCAPIPRVCGLVCGSALTERPACACTVCLCVCLRVSPGDGPAAPAS